MPTRRVLAVIALMWSNVLAVRPTFGWKMVVVDPAWPQTSSYNTVCRDPENCGPYGGSGRCRDAFCGSCALGSCESLEQAKACCSLADNCTAVYGGGAHWWTFHATCVEEEHQNFYKVWHRNFSHTPAPPTPAPQTNTTTPAPTPHPEPARFPADVLTCDKGIPPARTECRSPQELLDLQSQIRSSVKNHFSGLETDCNDTRCPRGDFVGCITRLVGHDVMDHNPDSPTDDKGGADGCIDFDDPDNKGLQGCLLESVHEEDSSHLSLEGLWQDFCDQVSISDFFVIAAEALIVEVVPAEHRSKWETSFTSGFQFGRKTRLTCAPLPLPNPADSCSAVEAVFGDRMGLTGEGAAALMGVHTLGRALPTNSGYNGFWTEPPHASQFTTEYYIRMMGAGWKTQSLDGDKKQWIRADVENSEMMLNTDLCLVYDTTQGVDPETGLATSNVHAETMMSEDCIWFGDDHPQMEHVECRCSHFQGNSNCHFHNCCGNSNHHGGFDSHRSTSWENLTFFGSSSRAVMRFAHKSEGMNSFHDEFVPVWHHVTGLGQPALCPAR